MAGIHEGLSIFPYIVGSVDNPSANFDTWNVDEKNKFISRHQVVESVAVRRDFDGFIKKTMKIHGIMPHSNDDDIEEFLGEVVFEILKSKKPVTERGWVNWVQTVVRRVALNEVQRQQISRKRAQGNLFADNVSAEQCVEIESFELRRQIIEVLGRESPDDIENLVAFVGSRSEVAQKLGWRIKRVKNFREKVTKLLKKIMERLANDLD